MPERLQVIPPWLRLAADETPLHYFFEPCGTYETTGVDHVFMAYGKEKRQVTGTPITNLHGELFFLQILWKGFDESVPPTHW